MLPNSDKHMTTQEQTQIRQYIGETLLSLSQQRDSARWLALLNTPQQMAHPLHLCTTFAQTAQELLQGEWATQLPIATTPKTVAIVLPQYISLEWLPEIVAVLLSGNRCVCRTSFDTLAERLLSELTQDNKLKDYITFTNQTLPAFDAWIVSAQSSLSQKMQYPNYTPEPQQSVCQLTGNETASELQWVAAQIMQYHTTGRRYIRKLQLPKHYNLTPLMEALQAHTQVATENSKYNDIIDYYRNIYTLNNQPFHDAQCVLLKEEKAAMPPSSVLYIEYTQTPDAPTPNALQQHLMQRPQLVQFINSIN